MMAKFLEQSTAAFWENYDWSTKVSKYNKNKAVANDVHKPWLNGILVLDTSY